MEPIEPMKPMEPFKTMEPMKPQQTWWPTDLGVPSSTGSQNEFRYAYFEGKRRLAVQDHGKITVYDAGENRINGISQQMAANAGEAKFTSQLGEVRLTELKVVEG